MANPFPRDESTVGRSHFGTVQLLANSPQTLSSMSRIQAPFSSAADQPPFCGRSFADIPSASALCLASVRLCYKNRFPMKKSCMRRVFPGVDFCHKHLPQWKQLSGPRALAVSLLLALASAAPLHAQSTSGPPSGLQRFSPEITSVNIDDRTQASSTIGLNSEPRSESFPLRSPIKVDTKCDSPQCGAWLGPEKHIWFFNPSGSVQSADAAGPRENPDASSGSVVGHRQRPDFNQDIYYRNRTEFGLDVGWHPINIPFVYDFAVGDSYNMTPLKYTLVPIIASLRWHVTNVGWRWIFRGNMDFTFSGSVTPIPRGPETHYYSFMFGIRRNFVYRNWKLVPFFEERGGAGMIDAKEPLGVLWAQGQNLTFTYNMGAGIRYNFDSKYSFSAGMNYMHISNGYLSEPQFVNYGINVYGPMFGMNVRLGKPHHHATE